MHGIAKRISFIILGLILILTSTGCSTTSSAPRAEQGVLDLRNWDFANSGIILLDGEWDFHWNRLLNYSDFKENEENNFVLVPETWDNYVMNQTELSGKGFATYRLRVQTNLAKGTLLALRLKTVSSAYQIFIDDTYLIGAGTVSTDGKGEKGAYHPQSGIFPVPNKEFDIIIQVSNFHYARGGLWDSLSLGQAEQIQNYENMLVGRETFLIGVLIIIALFYMAIFFLIRELKYTLYFSLLAFSAAISVDTVGEFLLFHSSIPFRCVISIWYGATGWLTFFLLMFMHELFPSGFSRIASRIYLCIMIVFQTIYIFVNPVYYTKFAFVSNLSECIAILVVCVIILIGARKGYKNWQLNIISISFLLFGYLHDILYLTNSIDSPMKEIFYWSSLVALMIQMITQAQRIKTYFDSKASAEMMLLQAQIKPHFLYNTINTIISVSRFDGERARDLLIDFGQYLRKSFDFKSSEQLVTLEHEIELAKAYIAIEKARFGNRLDVDFHIKGDIYNLKVPILVLQPIIENAIIHGVLPKAEGGTVDIQISREGKTLFFSVKDNGVGMDKAKLENILAGNTNHIGLSNIDSRLRRLYKQGLEMTSKEDEGTEIKWCTYI